MNREERTAAAREAIRIAAAGGFMDCKTIVRALYPDRFPDRPVRWDAAYRWLADAGVDVVYIVADGETDVPKAERTGCWSVDFPKVLAYKSAYYMQIAVNDWERNVEGGVQAGLSQEESEDMMGPSPPAPGFFVDTARKAGGTKPRRTQAQVERDAIASGARHEQTEDDRCREALWTFLASSSAPVRHSHIIEALLEWTGTGGRIGQALRELIDSGEVVMTQHEGFDGYLLAAKRVTSEQVAAVQAAIDEEDARKAARTEARQPPPRCGSRTTEGAAHRLRPGRHPPGRI